MSSSTLLPDRPATLPSAPSSRPAAFRVDIVVPVHNEQAALTDSIRRLHEFLAAQLPYAWRIIIANNASTDHTAAVARALQEDLDGVTLLDLPLKGRGRALRAAWSASDAHVVAYMDVDLSTDLNALLPLIAPLISGHSDVAIGTRLSRSSRVTRGPKREFISRTYNRLLRYSLGARFSDAQCGFKAVRGDVAQRLMPQIKDEAWFFDTELLVLAQRDGLRIHEVPVDWTDDPDSRVDIVDTAVEDLKGIVRLLASARPARFAAIGICSTLAYALLYLMLRGPLGAAGANAAGLALTAVANTQANRRFTFDLKGREGLVRQHLLGAGVFILTLGLTSGALSVLDKVDPNASRGVELAVLIAASICATITRYVALKTLVFARSGPLHRAVAAIARV